MSTAPDALTQAVQRNCDIADARHAGELTLCTYLLQMRDFCRWQLGLPWQAPLPRQTVADWISAREALWDGLADADFAPLPLPGGTQADPFDVGAVNAALQGSGRLYGAGHAGPARPVFFLADAHPVAPPSPLPVQVAARELARGLAAPPAVLDGRADPPTVVLRRESLARWCWQLVEGWSLRPRADAPFAAMLHHHPLDRDFERALPAWLDEQSAALVLHEQGEHAAGLALGPGWAALRQALPTRRGELHARALRDLLADLGVTLPELLARGSAASLHFWFAQFDGLRQQFLPTLSDAYRAWVGGDGGAQLRNACAAGHARLLALAQDLLARHAQCADGAALEAQLVSAAAARPPAAAA